MNLRIDSVVDLLYNEGNPIMTTISLNVWIQRMTYDHYPRHETLMRYHIDKLRVMARERFIDIPALGRGTHQQKKFLATAIRQYDIDQL